VSDRKETSKVLYAWLAKKHVSAVLGSITLDKLRATDVERLILSLHDRGLADSTVRSCYTVLRLALARRLGRHRAHPAPLAAVAWLEAAGWHTGWRTAILVGARIGVFTPSGYAFLRAA
jgi:hypothetical protein